MKLFKVLFQTNYGENVALVQANSIEKCRELCDNNTAIWDTQDVEEIILTNESKVLSIDGGE